MIVWWSEEDNAFVVDVPELPGCMADDSGFSLTVKCGVYTGSDAELTAWGRTIVPMLQARRR